MEKRIITTGCGDVHYRIGGPAGNGTVVFTHGATMDHRMFRSQEGYFSTKRRVITWDVPAHGESRPCSGFSLAGAADSLVSVLDTEKIDRVHLVGQSMGGYISQFISADCPERVLSLTAVDSSPLDSEYYSLFDRMMLALTAPMLRIYPYSSMIRTISSQVSSTRTGQNYARAVLNTLSKKEIISIMKEVYRGLLDFNSRERDIECPVLLVVGEHDTSGKVLSYCRRWSDKEAYDLKIVPGAAHNSNVDNPSDFNRILDEFLMSVEEDRSDS